MFTKHQTSLNPLDYHVWCVMLQAFHKLQSKPKTIPELKGALQQICDDLSQTTINKAINDFRKLWDYGLISYIQLTNFIGKSPKTPKL